MTEFSPSSDFERFLEDNYRLFAIMGIFGAISIYLNRLLESVSRTPQLTISQTETIIKLGIVSSLILFVIVSLILAKNYFLIIYRHFPTDVHFINYLEYVTSPKLTIYIALFLPFFLLELAILSISLNFTNAIIIIVNILSLLVGAGCCLLYYEIIDRIVSKSSLDLKTNKRSAVLLVSIYVSSQVPIGIALVLADIRLTYSNLIAGISIEFLPIKLSATSWIFISICLLTTICVFSLASLSDQNSLAIDTSERD